VHPSAEVYQLTWSVCETASQIGNTNTVGVNHFVMCVSDRQPDSQSIADHILAQSFTLRQRQQMKIWLMNHTQAHLAFTSHKEAFVIGAWVWNIQNNPSHCMMIEFINGTADEVRFIYFVNIIMSDTNVVHFETITCDATYTESKRRL
jgi:hypothetical protein